MEDLLDGYDTEESSQEEEIVGDKVGNRDY